LKATCSTKNCNKKKKNKAAQLGLSILNSNFSEIALFGGNLLVKVGILEFDSSSN
jgi:hypothetical protein